MCTDEALTEVATADGSLPENRAEVDATSPGFALAATTPSNHPNPPTVPAAGQAVPIMTPPVSTRRSFLRSSAAAAGTAALAGGPAPAQPKEGGGPLVAYVGTFSSPLKDVLPTQVDLPPGNGRGIHLFRVDRGTGAMTAAGVHQMGTSPSCLALNAAGTRLYSANETDRVGEPKEGTVSAFAVDRADGTLKPLTTVRSGGAGPTHVSVHPSGRFVLVANYFGGSVAVLPVLEDGSLGAATDVKTDAGKVGPTKATNAPAGSFAVSGHDRTHAHQIQADPSGRFVLHVDLGLDKIYVWKFDDKKGTLAANDPPAVSLPPGDGPRHLHFHPNGRWLYSVQEEGSTVVLFDYDAAAGRLAPRQTVPTLPRGFVGSNFCSEILVSADGRFVYAGNRLHDTVAVLSVGPDGTLSYVGEEWTRGDYPRSFGFDPTGSFLFCCNQRADHVTVFRVDRRTGGLSFTGQYAPVGNPSSIAFLDLDKGR
jgi:6-phosphogluconolactonase (cycloisomerase 2 family)